MTEKPAIDWGTLDYAGFARIAADERLSKYEKIGFPDSYRAGFELAIFADIRAKLADLRKMEKVLRGMVASCADGTLPECPLIDTLSGTGRTVGHEAMT